MAKPPQLKPNGKLKMTWGIRLMWLGIGLTVLGIALTALGKQ